MHWLNTDSQKLKKGTCTYCNMSEFFPPTVYKGWCLAWQLREVAGVDWGSVTLQYYFIEKKKKNIF